jgi:hypothetical protein
MKYLKYSLLLLAIILPACSTLMLRPADFAWPIESVLKVDENGTVEDQRFSFSFNTKDLYLEETGDSSAYMNKDLHVIRDTKGYYFMTGNNFKNVYVFNVNDGAFNLNNKIVISDSTGIENPGFNQRPPYVELDYSGKKVNLTNEGIKEEENQ